MKHELNIISTTIDDQVQADKLANKLISLNLAACIQIDEIQSVYSWKDEIVNEKEFRMTIKTSNDKNEEVKIFLQNNHPYEIPEILEMKGQLNREYYEWAVSQTM